MAIRGGSAGGYTVLQAVCSHPDFFAAATSSYGISDLAALEEDTHKFESRQLEKLIGGTTKEIPEVYKERSPMTHANKIVTPLLVSIFAYMHVEIMTLVADIARIRRPCCPAKSVQVYCKLACPSGGSTLADQNIQVDAIKKRNGVVKYIEFEGEGHGWRRAENIKKALLEETKFYEETFKVHQ